MSTLLENAQKKEDETTALIAENRELKAQRPAFHFASPAGWINDPNGFSFFENKCHLFFQYHPYGVHWGPMYWGHTVTDDFIIWKREPVVLAPDTDADCSGCFSGTAVEVDGKHIIAYTGVTEKDGVTVQNQCIAVGDGEVYTKLSCNPVITAENVPFKFDERDFRDPKIWYEDGRYFIAAVLRAADGCGALVLFTSEDLIKWTYVSTLDSSGGKTGHMWECPDIFRLGGKYIIVLCLQGMDADRRGYFCNGNNSVYMSGCIDEHTHTFIRDERPENGMSAAVLDYGIDFYAPETTGTPDGRQIMTGWMHNWESYSTPEGYLWSGMMTIPRELSFKKNRLYQQPVRELKKYRINHVSGNKNLNADRQPVQGITGRLLDLELCINAAGKGILTIYFAADERHYVSLVCDLSAHTLTFDRTYCGYCRDVLSVRTIKFEPDTSGILQLRCILDICSLEVFIDGGRYAFTNTFYTPPEAQSILFSADTPLSVNYNCWQIKIPEEKK